MVLSSLFILMCDRLLCCQVAAQTKHDVTLVDVSDHFLKRSRKTIETSLARVAKKRFADDAAVSIEDVTKLCLPCIVC